MLEILFELVFSFLFELVFAALGVGAEYTLYKTGKRFWMWAFGLVLIAGMIWWRGAQMPTTWLIAAGWLGMLIFYDRRLAAGRETRP